MVADEIFEFFSLLNISIKATIASTKPDIFTNPMLSLKTNIPNNTEKITETLLLIDVIAIPACRVDIAKSIKPAIRIKPSKKAR
jgi:hypothetical protein